MEEYRQYLIGNETKEEVSMLDNAIKAALSWAGAEIPKNDKNYYSDFDLATNMVFVSQITGYSEKDIIYGNEYIYSYARKLFCYISSNKNNWKSIAKYIKRSTQMVRSNTNTIRMQLKLGDKKVVNDLNRILKLY